MDPERKQRDLSKAISDGINCLAIFLCGPAFQRLKGETPELLDQWETEHLPVFRKLALAGAQGDAATLRAAFARISAVAKGPFDPDAAEQVIALRAAIREAFVAMRLPLPTHTEAEAAVCELHGAECPFAKGAPREG